MSTHPASPCPGHLLVSNSFLHSAALGGVPSALLQSHGASPLLSHTACRPANRPSAARSQERLQPTRDSGGWCS